MTLEPTIEMTVTSGASGRLRATLTSQRARRILLPSIAAIVVLGFWQWFTGTGRISPLILPSPASIVEAVFRNPGLYLWHGSYTTFVAVGGFFLGNALGLAAAMLFVQARTIRNAIYPLAIVSQAIPIVAVVPAIMLWLGSGLEPKVFITTFLTFFPMLVNAMKGLESTSTEGDELFRSLSATRWQKMRALRLPTALPLIFAALRLGATACMVSAIVAEWIASDRGLGFMIVFYSAQYRMADVWAAALIGTLLSLAFYYLVVLAEKKVMPWMQETKLE